MAKRMALHMSINIIHHINKGQKPQDYFNGPEKHLTIPQTLS